MGDLDEHHLVVRMFESVLNVLILRGAVTFGFVRFSDPQVIASSSERESSPSSLLGDVIVRRSSTDPVTCFTLMHYDDASVIKLKKVGKAAP